MNTTKPTADTTRPETGLTDRELFAAAAGEGLPRRPGASAAAVQAQKRRANLGDAIADQVARARETQEIARQRRPGRQELHEALVAVQRELDGPGEVEPPAGRPFQEPADTAPQVLR